MGLFRRVAHRKLARALSVASGTPWRSRGLRDRSRFVEGEVEGRRVGVNVWTYLLHGGSSPTLYVTLARDPGALLAMKGRWSGPMLNAVSAPRVSPAGEDEITVRAADPDLPTRILPPETLAELSAGRRFFILSIRPPGPRTLDWGEDQTPLPFTAAPTLSFYGLRGDARPDEYLETFRLLLAIARRAEAPA